MSHSKYFSPSSISRRITCHLSAFLEDEAPPQKSSDAADYGTYGHFIAEDVMSGNSVPEDYLGQEMFGQVCDQQLIDCVHQYLNDVEEVKALYTTEPTVRVESKVNMAGYGMPEVYGTADLILDEMFGVLTIMDLKTGSGVNVNPEHNAQLMTYALCCAGSMAELGSYTMIRMAISQPRAKTKGKSLKVWEITPQELATWCIEVLRPCFDAITSSNKDSATYNVTESGCMWCSGKNDCHAFTSHNLALAKLDFSVVKPDLPVIDAQLVGEVYPHLKLMKSFIKQVEAKGYELAQVGALKGHKVVKGKRSRSWLDDDEAVELITGLGFDAYEKKMLSPAKAEKLLGLAAVKDYIKVNDGKPVVVKESDKREAIDCGFSPATVK